jgi:hypothetical protein
VLKYPVLCPILSRSLDELIVCCINFFVDLKVYSDPNSLKKEGSQVASWFVSL